MSDVSAALESMLQRISALEKEVAALKGEAIPEEPSFDESEAIDLSLDAIMVEELAAAESVAEPAPVETVEIQTIEDIPAEDIPAEEMPEDMPEDMPAPEPEVAEPAVEPEPEPEPVAEPEPEPAAEPVEGLPEPDDFSNLFGSEFDEVVEVKPKRGRKPSAGAGTIVNDAAAGNAQAVMDVLAEKSAWLRDIPGAEVKSLRSAIALGDQVLYIRRLFREDSALYQDTIDKLNAMSTLKEAVDYLSSTFPEWDTEGEDVYRFMMAVRRKIRK